MLNKATEPKEIIIRTGVGEPVKEVLMPADYYTYDDSQATVVKLSKLIELGEKYGVKISNDRKLDICTDKQIVYRGMWKVGERTGSELGEANELNLETEIQKQYPAITADNRCLSRCYVAGLGLKNQGVYSDAEFGKVSPNSESKQEKTANPPKDKTPEKTTKKDEKPKEPTEPTKPSSRKESAGEVICNLGFYKNKPKKVSEITANSASWINEQTFETAEEKKVQEAVRVYFAEKLNK